MGFVDFWPFGSIFNRFGLTVNALVMFQFFGFLCRRLIDRRTIEQSTR